MLAQILNHLGASSEETLGLALDACRAAWPGGFVPGADGLRGLAQPIAEHLASARANPEVWLRRLRTVLARLGFDRSNLHGFEPDSLAAHVIACSAQIAPEEVTAPSWRLRQFLFDHDEAWRALSEDIRRKLEGGTPQEGLDALKDWDRRLTKGMDTARFFELWLNSTPGSVLGAVIAARGSDLRTLPDLPWWNHGATPGAFDDLRDAFARLAPLAPLPEQEFPAVQAWMRRPIEVQATSAQNRDLEPDLVPIEGEVRAASRGSASPLSPFGLARWRCLEALTSFYREGIEGQGCWQIVAGWTDGLPLDQLEANERRLFLSWLIPRLEEPDGVEIARLASWLVRSGMTDPDRLRDWAECLEPYTTVAPELKLGRAALVGDLRAEWRTLLRERGIG
jgi:hypothetical protein